SMALGRKCIHLVAVDLPAVGYALGTFALMDQIVAAAEIRIELLEATADVAEHRRARHALDPAADGIVHIARRDCLGGKMHGLLARTAHAIERHRRHLDRETRKQHGKATYIGSLFAGLGHTAGDYVVKLCRVYLGALDQALQRVRE